MRFERYLIMEKQKPIKKQKKVPMDKVRKPLLPPNKAHDDKSKYSRKEKHKKGMD
jgi:hypothetical protein